MTLNTIIYFLLSQRKSSTDSSGNGNSSSPDCPKKKAKLQERKKSKMKVEEPVCLTISSDEESSEQENLLNIRSESSTIGNDTSFNFSCDPAVTQSAMLKEPVINDDNNASSNFESMETGNFRLMLYFVRILEEIHFMIA